jgi:hypothetical protein
MPRQPDANRKSRAKPRASGTPRTRRTPEEVERALLRDSGSNAKRLGSRLAQVDAQTSQDVVSHLGHEVGNSVMHRVLTHAASVAAADRTVTITFGAGANSARFTPEMRQVLEAILRKAHLQAAVVIAIGEKPGASSFDIAPGSISDEAAFVEAAEAAVGSDIDGFRRPPAYAGYHFEIAH